MGRPANKAIIVAATGGVLTHFLVFIHGEWHMHATRVLGLVVACFSTMLMLDIWYYAESLFVAVASVGALCGVFCISLFASIVIYRLFFHRLRGFPGPILAKASKLWHVIHCLDSKNHLLMDRLHQEYGDFVRTGPNELTVFTPDVLQCILEGQKSQFDRPAWHDNLQPYIGLTNQRDRKVHDPRRRIWDHGFTTQAIKTYQVHIKRFAHQLEQTIAESESLPIVANDYFAWFTFDVMGYFAFSKSFNMLRDKKHHDAIHLIRSGMSLVGPFSPVPWAIRIGFEIPLMSMARDLHRLLGWCAEQMDERIERTEDTQDISQYLIKGFSKQNRLTKDRKVLYGDALGMIVAGSDTTASTLTCISYHLALDPFHLEKLQNELDSSSDITDISILATLPHLNGIINETLRLHPAVPTGGLRETPPEGATISGRFVPGGTVICAPRWTLGRLESCFVRPHEFIPERWYSELELVKNRSVLVPFALGRHACIGKSLALSELRYITALLASKYDISFAPDDKDYGRRVEGDMRDRFTAAPGELRVVFRPR